MKVQIALLSLLALAGVALFFQENNFSTLQSSNDMAMFKSYVMWKNQYGQNTNGSEDEYRFNIYKQNYEFVQKHNAQDKELVLGMNKFAAMTNEEFRDSMLMKNPVEVKEFEAEPILRAGSLPNSIDWVKKGAVAPVVNQGSCGSCWAFASVATLEGLNYIKNGNLVEFSQQQLVSCMTPKTFGCNGANTFLALTYTKLYGIETLEDYPYTNGASEETDTNCKYEKSKVAFKNTGYGKVPTNDTTAMKSQLVEQPLAISVDAASIYFQLYKKGILNTTKCGTELNHAITLVGYNTESDPYWIVKNSWGTGWGLQGFANIAITEGDGVCGINMDVSYPKLN